MWKLVKRLPSIPHTHTHTTPTKTTCSAIQQIKTYNTTFTTKNMLFRCCRKCISFSAIAPSLFTGSSHSFGPLLIAQKYINYEQYFPFQFYHLTRFNENSFPFPFSFRFVTLRFVLVGCSSLILCVLTDLHCCCAISINYSSIKRFVRKTLIRIVQRFE